MDNGKRAVYVGDRYDMLEVLEYVGSQGKSYGSHSLWRCKCDCGKEVIIPSYRLRPGLSASCGCMSATNRESFAACKKESIKAARDLFYPEEAVKDLQATKTEGEIERIMIKARHGGYKTNGKS